MQALSLLCSTSYSHEPQFPSMILGMIVQGNTKETISCAVSEGITEVSSNCLNSSSSQVTSFDILCNDLITGDVKQSETSPILSNENSYCMTQYCPNGNEFANGIEISYQQLSGETEMRLIS